MKRFLFLSVGVLFLVFSSFFLSSYFFNIPFVYHYQGKQIDEFNGVSVFYNSSSSSVTGISHSTSGYEFGPKWQCVEFVRRYFFEVFDYSFPNQNGNARDFYDSSLGDGELNSSNGLIQCSNPSRYKPGIGEILIFDGFYGHVGIISEVSDSYIDIVQQNVGLTTRSRYSLSFTNGSSQVLDNKVLGRLKLP